MLRATAGTKNSGGLPSSSHHLAIKDPLEEDGLGGLGSHVSVGGLLRYEDATDLAQVSVDLVHLHLDCALADVKDFVGLLEELLLALLAVCLQGRQRHRLIVASVHAAALGVKEASGTVGGNVKLASPREARLELGAAASGLQLLHGEKEGHVLAVRQLHGRRREIH